MLIPVEVQQPCKPESARVVGEASEDLTPIEVARKVGLPEECFGPEGAFIDGKIVKRKGAKRWSLVADVVFREG